MSDETTGRNPDAAIRPQGRQAAETDAPDMPPTAGPHSPGSVKPATSDPESGGYERHQTDRSTNNAKGGYGAG